MRWPGLALARSDFATLNSIVMAGMKSLISSCVTMSTWRPALASMTSPVSGHRFSPGAAGVTTAEASGASSFLGQPVSPISKHKAGTATDEYLGFIPQAICQGGELSKGLLTAPCGYHLNFHDHSESCLPVVAGATPHTPALRATPLHRGECE